MVMVEVVMVVVMVGMMVVGGPAAFIWCSFNMLVNLMRLMREINRHGGDEEAEVVVGR